MVDRIVNSFAGRRAFVAAAMTCALSAGLLAAPGLMSAWRSQAIAIDGAPDEWPKLDTIEKSLATAVANDDEFLYLTVSTTDQQMRGLLSTGLIVWFDPSGGNKQTFGVWIGGVEPPLLPGMTPDAPRSTSSGRTSRVLTEFDLLGPNKNQRRLVDITPGLGVELATGTEDTAITSEIKVPLASTADRKYAINAKAGAIIGLGLASPERARERGRRPLVGSGGRVGGNPYHGGAGGGGFADFPEPDERAKPIALWTTVKLAVKP